SKKSPNLEGNFGLLRLKYGQPCKADYECSTGFRCMDSSCRCPKNSVWSNEHQRCKVCPYRWLPFNDKCYFISDTKKDWHGAKLECEHRKSSLLVIEPEHVLDFSINFFNACRLTSSFYVGAKADVLPGNWTWLNGKSIPSSGHIWANCYSPTKSGDDALKLVNGCALLGKFGLSASNCQTRESFICYQDENSKFKMSPFTQVKHSFQIMNEIEKKCNYDYQCPHGQKCIQSICSCDPGSVYAFGSKKCIDSQIVGFVDYLATKQSDDLFVSNNTLTWYDAYMWSLSNKWNLYAPKNLLDLIHLSEFLAQNNLEGPFWIGGIRIDNSNFWIDKKRIEDGPWFRSFKNCNFNLANSVENLCLAIEKNELVFRDCLSDFKFIAFEGSLNNSIDLADFNISLPLVRITRTLTLRNVIVVTPLPSGIRMRRSSELVSPILTQVQDLVIRHMQTIFVSYTCTGFWISNADGSFSLTLVAFKVFPGIEYENEIEIYNAYFDRFDLFFTANKALYISILRPGFTILKIEIFAIELIDVREEIFLTLVIVSTTKCAGFSEDLLVCTTTVLIKPNDDVPNSTTLSPLTSSSTTVASTATTTFSSSTISTTVASTTIASTTIASTTIASTTIASTTIASTTVASTTAASTTVASTTEALTTAVSTTVASTAIELTTLIETTARSSTSDSP
ncbi:lysine-specific demethylase PHF2, partial [Brachionus plicatilis]